MSINCATYDNLINMNDALLFLLEQAVSNKKIKKIKIIDAYNAILASDIIANINVVDFNSSAMDGYAVNFDDTLKPPYTFNIVGRISAGERSTIKLKLGDASRIFTGAVIPKNCNAIVVQERCEQIDNKLEVFGYINKNENIRVKGSDVKKGDTILTKGRQLKSADIALCAAIGCNQISVFNKIKVGVFFSGNEIIMPDENLTIGKIYNSNQFSVIGLLQELNCEIINLGIIKDNLNDSCVALEQLAKDCDIIITTGGVSVGEEDHIKTAVAKLGTIKMWQVKIKPGKPLSYGKINTTHFIGLPGNPVSVMVTFILFAKPFIKKISGNNSYLNIKQQVQIDFAWKNPKDRREFIRVKLDNSTIPATATMYKTQDSNVLSSISWADGLLEIPESNTYNKGAILNFYPL